VAGDTSLWKCCNPDTMAKVVDRARCSPIPILATLPLHRDARGIAELAQRCRVDTPLASFIEPVEKPTDK
jgi:hypothetical protein